MIVKVGVDDVGFETVEVGVGVEKLNDTEPYGALALVKYQMTTIAPTAAIPVIALAIKKALVFFLNWH